MEENRLYQALRLERSRGGRTVSKQTSVLRVKIPAGLRKKIKILQIKGAEVEGRDGQEYTADEVTSEILRVYFEEHP